jgi:hypothetical protein
MKITLGGDLSLVSLLCDDAALIQAWMDASVLPYN